MTDLYELVVDVPLQPFSMNRAINEHRFARSKRIAMTRSLAKRCALEVMPDEPRPLFWSVEIEVQPWGKSRQFRQDIGNCMASVKGIIDGFVDAGVIPDDDDTHLTRLSFLPHQFGRMAIVLKIVGTLYDPGKEVVPVKTTHLF